MWKAPCDAYVRLLAVADIPRMVWGWISFKNKIRKGNFHQLRPGKEEPSGDGEEEGIWIWRAEALIRRDWESRSVWESVWVEKERYRTDPGSTISCCFFSSRLCFPRILRSDLGICCFLAPFFLPPRNLFLFVFSPSDFFFRGHLKERDRKRRNGG